MARTAVLVAGLILVALISSGCRDSQSRTTEPDQDSQLREVTQRVIQGVVVEGAGKDRLWLIRSRGAQRHSLGFLRARGEFRALASQSVGQAPQGLAYGFEAVWVANGFGDDPARPGRFANSVTRVRSSDGRRTRLIPVTNPSAITVTRLGVWVAAEDALKRLDPEGRVTATLHLPARVIVRLAAMPNGVAAAMTSPSGVSHVWVVDDASLRVRRARFPARAYAIGHASGWLWISLSGRVMQLRADDLGTARSRAIRAPGMIVPVSKARAYVALGDRGLTLLEAKGAKLRATGAWTDGRADSVSRVGDLLYVYDSNVARMTVLRLP